MTRKASKVIRLFLAQGRVDDNHYLQVAYLFNVHIFFILCNIPLHIPIMGLACLQPDYITLTQYKNS